MTALRYGLIVCLAAYACIVLAMYLKQRQLMFLPENKGLKPETVGLAEVESMVLDTPDGERLVTWHVQADEVRPTVLYLHGNAGEIGDRPERFRFYRTHGLGVLYVSYRGYGGSSGSPSERGLIIDALTAYDWLIASGVPGDRIALVGESLGAGVAVQLAARRPVAAIALEAPFSSAADVAAPIYWWLPVRLLMLDQFKSLDHIGSIRAPLLIQHGDADTIVPVALGKRLYAAANEPKELVIVAGGTHESPFDEAAWSREVAFFDRWIGK